VDPITSGHSPIVTVETIRDALGDNESWIISRLPHQVAVAMQKAGASRIIGKNGPHAGNVFAYVAEALGVQDYTPGMDAVLRQLWVHSISEAAPDTINALRVSLHEFVKDPRKDSNLYDLFRQTHVLSHRASMIELNALSRLTEALDALVYDVYAMPDQINPSIVRSISQALDFVSILFEEENIGRLKDPDTAEVCVIDDEPAAQQMIAAAMKLVGLKITGAENRDAAMSALSAKSSDLIFLDVNLPQSSGFDICAQIRQIDAHRATPIVFLTGMNTFQNRAQGSISGGNDFIGKPFNLLELGVKALMWIFKGQLARS
jgi:CheY-like chemotaxis protein